MIKKIVRIREFEIQHIDTLVLDHFINLVLDFASAIDNSPTIKRHHVQHTMEIRNNEELRDHISILLSKVIPSVLFLEPNIEIEIISENTLFSNNFHQNHVHDLHVQQEGMSMP